MNRKAAWIIGITGTGVLLVVTLGILFRGPLQDLVREVRSERLAEQAEASFAEEDWEAAARQGRAAHYLAPEDKGIQILVARALLKQRSQNAVQWWKLVVEEPELPVEELRTLTEALVARGDLEDGLLFLSRLVELDGENPATQRLWLRALRDQRRFRNFATLTENLVERGSEDWSIHRDYLRLRGREEGMSMVAEHLAELVEAEGPLALQAARELVGMEAATEAERRRAADWLREHGEDRMDRLYAESLAVKLGEADFGEVEALFKAVAEEPEPGELEMLLSWAEWMGQTARYVEEVDWAAYRENGASAVGYLGALAELGRYAEIRELAQTASAVNTEDRPALLYYRSVALLETGEEERSRETLRVAVETVNPAQSLQLERLLMRGGYWGLLTELYAGLLENQPENPVLLFKNMTAEYYAGRQGRLRDLLERFQAEAEEAPMEQRTLELYLSLLLEGPKAETHQQLEELMARYPQVFDLRLVVGVSWLMQERGSLARELVAGMPEMGLTAPRHLRVAAILLGSERSELLAPGEWDQLLDRERFLLSARRAQSAP